MESDPIDQTAQEISDWPRVSVKFDCPKFITEHMNKFPDLFSSSKFSPQGTDSQLINTAYQILFKIKEHYKKSDQYESYIYSYLSIAKFLIAHNYFPPNLISHDQKKKYISKLIDKIGIAVIPHQSTKGKAQKWLNIYEGMLFHMYALNFATLEKKSTHFSNAYLHYKTALELKTTKTVCYLIAQLILDDNYTPQNMTRGEAEALAYDYIKKARDHIEIVTKRSGTLPHESPTLIAEKFARPTYLKDINPKLADGQNIPALTTNRMDIDTNINDPLSGFDWSTLHIIQKITSLPERSDPINTIDQPHGEYIIQGNRYRIQNVSGQRMRCFFNAFGLNAEQQIALLRANQNNPTVRYMIANDIISAARDHTQIPPEIKQAINFDLYQDEQKKLDQLQIERARLLQVNGGDTDSLPREYQYATLDNHQNTILSSLRTRCLTLDAYNAFIDYNIANNQMMAFISDMAEPNIDQLTSIDAIATLNNIGIEIYRLQPDGTLRQTHKYIPEAAVALTRLYHSGEHFQALVPIAENLEMPSDRELQGLYPDINHPMHARSFTDTEIRRVLYLHKKLKLNYEDIALQTGLDQRRISEICIANGIVKFKLLPSDITKTILQAYLECYELISQKKISKTQFSKNLTQKLSGISYEQILNFLSQTRGKKFETNIKNIPAETKLSIIRMYKEGQTFTDIRETTKVSYLVMIEILSEKIQPSEYKNPVGLIFEIASATKSEQIIQTFNKLKSSGKPCKSRDVVNYLNDPNFSYKVVHSVLTKQGLVTQEVKSKHLSTKIIDQIRQRYAELESKNSSYKHMETILTKEFPNVSHSQFSDIRKGSTYNGQSHEKNTKNRNNVIAAFNKLTPDQRKNPVSEIHKAIGLGEHLIRAHLLEAGLYTPKQNKSQKQRETSQIKRPHPSAKDSAPQAKRRKVIEESSDEDMPS